MCAFRWAGIIGMAIQSMKTLAGTAVLGKAIQQDVDRIANAILACTSMVHGTMVDRRLVEQIVGLVASKDKAVPLRILGRLTKGLQRLVNDERNARLAEQGVD